MIVIGYQGIGKSTICKDNPRYIDFESSALKVNGHRLAGWHIPYCQMAVELSKQGYVVFTSSHKEVREYLEYCGEFCVLIFPELSLKEKWIEKLKQRSEESGLEKDEAAYLNAVARYDENISELRDTKMWRCILYSLHYNLKSLVSDMEEKEKERESIKHLRIVKKIQLNCAEG